MGLRQIPTISWAKKLDDVVGESASYDILWDKKEGKHRPRHLIHEDSANIWYGREELQAIDEQMKTLLVIYQQKYNDTRASRQTLREVEDEFMSRWGHSLRGLEAYEDGDVMMYHIKTSRAIHGTCTIIPCMYVYVQLSRVLFVISISYHLYIYISY